MNIKAYIVNTVITNWNLVSKYYSCIQLENQFDKCDAYANFSFGHT